MMLLRKIEDVHEDEVLRGLEIVVGHGSGGSKQDARDDASEGATDSNGFLCGAVRCQRETGRSHATQSSVAIALEHKSILEPPLTLKKHTRHHSIIEEPVCIAERWLNMLVALQVEVASAATLCLEAHGLPHVSSAITA